MIWAYSRETSKGFAMRLGIYLTKSISRLRWLGLIFLERSERERSVQKETCRGRKSAYKHGNKTPAQRYWEWKGTSIPGRGMVANPHSRWWDKRLFYLEIWINHIEMSRSLHLIAAIGIKPVKDFNVLCKCCIFFLCKNSLRLTAFFWTICQFLYFWICGRIKITPTHTGNINDNIRFRFLLNRAATWIAPARIFSLCTTFLSRLSEVRSRPGPGLFLWTWPWPSMSGPQMYWPWPQSFFFLIKFLWATRYHNSSDLLVDTRYNIATLNSHPHQRKNCLYTF